MLRLTLLIFVMCCFVSGMAQTPADWWYFGNHAGMHFTTSGPVAVGDGQCVTSEGCTSISDQAGDLLFYSDGQTVYDRTHNIMPNGSGLLGAASSTHSGMIVPRPGNQNLYYIFTVDDGGTSGVGMHYSLVDMTLNSGLGDVVTAEKNVFLVDSTCEKIAGIKKSNGYWVVTTTLNGDKMYAYEVTSSGVNTTPVVSNTGFPIGLDFGFGIKPSLDGTKIAAVHFGTDSVHIYDFNPANGAAVGAYKIGTTMSTGHCYGLEFSPDGNRLYLQGYATADVRQFDLTLGNSAAISASETTLGSGSGGGMLQLGPDSKIYCARMGQSIISVINDPNALGTLADWQDTAVVLTSGTNSNYGLPTFMQSFFEVSSNADGFCLNDQTQFSMDTNEVDSAKWNFGDPTTGALNISTQYFPTHVYSDTGTFTVTLIAWSDTLVDTVTSEIYIYPRQSVNLGPDSVFCNGDTIDFSVSQPFSSFLWQDGSTNDSMRVFEDTTIWVTVFGICDTVSDTAVFSFDFPVFIDLGPDTSLCGGSAYVLDANLGNVGAVWGDGTPGDSITVTANGTYTLSAENQCGIFADTVVVTFLPVAGTALLPPDTINCFDNAIVLSRPNDPNTQYFWNDSTTKATYTVDTTEVVWLAALNKCGLTVDTMTLVFYKEIKVDLGPDSMICPDDSIVLNARFHDASYVWNTGDTTDTIWTTQEDFTYVVTVTLGACSDIFRRRIELNDLACPHIDCDLFTDNVFTPDGDGLNDLWRPRSDCEIYSYDLRIYNRWGQLVYSGSHAGMGWDGNLNGSPLPEGVYYYLLEFRDDVVVNVDRLVFQGSLTLMR